MTPLYLSTNPQFWLCYGVLNNCLIDNNRPTSFIIALVNCDPLSESISRGTPILEKILSNASATEQVSICLRQTHPTSAYSRNVGGSTLRVPVEVLSQCLQSPRRRFYAPSACRGASPRCLQSQRRRFYASSAYRGAIQQRLSSQRRRFYAPSWKCHIRRNFKDTATSRRPSSEPERRPNISTTPRKDCELIPSCWEGLGGF